MSELRKQQLEALRLARELFDAKVLPDPEIIMIHPRTYSIGGTWGYHVQWLDFPNGRVWGHYTPRPKIGDLLYSEMQSGRTGVFRFTVVDLPHDPPDMFFGTVEDVGYLDELDGAL